MDKKILRCKYVDFCIVNYQGKDIEVEELIHIKKINDMDSLIKVNNIPMVISSDELDELIDDMLK